jgi:uncharacterized protein (DUF362 family)
MTISRRKLLIGTGAVAAGASVSVPFFLPRYRRDCRPRRSRVAILRIEDYVQSIQDSLRRGFQLFRLDVKGETVVLKPNLVDYIPDNAINTHPILVVAAAECFRELGAKEVIVAEGPGHQRDTQLVLCESGYESLLRENRIRFVDLNRDGLMSVNLSADYSGLKRLWLPRAILGADFLVSMPKVKTHHWSGVTLSMKNMFGVVPGNKYGWPKNILHWHGIQESILDLCVTVPIHFVIADAIMCMEGNGPLNGSPRWLGCVVLADDPVAADATCARLMGLEPDRVPHIYEAAKFLGNSSPDLVEQIGELARQPEVPFRVVPEFEFLHSAG